MFCEKCGKEIKDGDKFCPYCGAENKINKEEPSHDIPPDFSVKGAGKKKKGAVIAIAVLVIIVAIGIFKCSSTMGRQSEKSISIRCSFFWESIKRKAKHANFHGSESGKP